MGKIYVCQYRDIIQKVFLLWSLMSNYVNNHMILLMYFKICHLWWIRCHKQVQTITYPCPPSFPLLSATTASPCLMLVSYHIRSAQKHVRTTPPYPCYIQSTSYSNINPLETTHPSFLLQTPTMYSS